MANGLSRAVGAVVKSKVGAAVLATVLAAGGASGVAAAAANGAFGQQVKEQVQDCKAALATGEHGIGECVSDFAQHHGQQKQRQDHSQDKSGTHGNGHSDNPGNHDKPTATPGDSGGHGKP